MGYYRLYYIVAGKAIIINIYILRKINALVYFVIGLCILYISRLYCFILFQGKWSYLNQICCKTKNNLISYQMSSYILKTI